MNIIDKKSTPYLQLLTVRTRLSDSPLVKKMLKSKGEFWLKIAKDDAACNPDAEVIWSDIDRRWPQLSSAFSRKVDLISGIFFKSVLDSSKAFKAGWKTVDGYLAGKTFSGTIIAVPRGVTTSYSMSFDSNGDPDDIFILMLDSHGVLLAYISPTVQFVTRYIQNMVLDIYGREMGNLSSLVVGASVIVDTTCDYILYSHLASVKAELVPRCGSHGEAQLAGDPDAMVNCFPFDIWRLTGDGPFAFPEASSGENDADND